MFRVYGVSGVGLVEFLGFMVQGFWGWGCFPEAFSPPSLFPFLRFASLPTSLSSSLSSLHL